MIVHLYAQMWNEEWMLPFFFRHYDPIVDRYFLFDDGSTDGGLEIARRHPKVELAPFPRSASESFVLSEQQFSNECWKASRGVADWVIVTDLDEHLFHPYGRGYLRRCTAAAVTMVPALGFQMISERMPDQGATLAYSCTRGAPWVQMMKVSIFNPDAICEIDYGEGRHIARPVGRIQLPDVDETLLLHYKYIGYERTKRRHLELRERLGATDLERGWAHKYSWTEDEFRKDWENVSRDATFTMGDMKSVVSECPLPRWWDKYRSHSNAKSGEDIVSKTDGCVHAEG